MPTVRVNDITMNYEIHGEGEPLVLIAGLGAGISVGRKLAGAFSEKHRVIAFDNRGVGLTDRPDMPYTIGMMADDTIGLMDALGIAKAHVLGISLGGRIALDIAIRHPDRVMKLVPVSTFASQPKKKLPKAIHALKLIEASTRPFRKQAQPYYAFMRQLEASRCYVCRERLGDIRAPTLIMHGLKDSIAPFELAEELHAGIRGSRLMPFKGGHTFSFSQRELFVREAVGFLTSR